MSTMVGPQVIRRAPFVARPGGDGPDGRMIAMVKTLPVVLEVGTKKVFASAVDWPGWSRSGRTE